MLGLGHNHTGVRSRRDRITIGDIVLAEPVRKTPLRSKHWSRPRRWRVVADKVKPKFKAFAREVAKDTAKQFAIGVVAVVATYWWWVSQ